MQFLQLRQDVLVHHGGRRLSVPSSAGPLRACPTEIVFYRKSRRPPAESFFKHSHVQRILEVVGVVDGSSEFPTKPAAEAARLLFGKAPALGVPRFFRQPRIPHPG